MTAIHNKYFGRDLEAMSFARNYHLWILSEFAPYLVGQVAEIGAGSGNFSEMLLTQPKIDTLLALEPSTNMYPLLEERLRSEPRARAMNTTLDAIYRDQKERFDTITYINVLEHIENDLLQLQYAYETLKPCGHLLIFVPALPALFSNFDREIGHFRRYTRKQLRSCALSAGYIIDRQKYFDVAGILPWYVAFVMLKLPMTTGNVSTYDTWVVPLMRAAESRIPPPIGKNLLLVARKP